MRLQFASGEAFEAPFEVLRADDPASAEAALRRADALLDEGFWIAGYLTYELGAAFVREPMQSTRRPLLVLGAYRAPTSAPVPDGDAASWPPPLPQLDVATYLQRVAAIRRSIYDGEVYQVNLTVPFAFRVVGDPRAAFDRIAAQAGPGYHAYVEDGSLALLSWSPELFLRFDGERICTKPMKGTAPLDAIEELHDAKNRAEHVMIVDLLRNDLQRVCDDVRVDDAFTIERYPTFATMTATISGRPLAGTGLLDILRATFPCGSITGAPKKAAVAQIARIESQERGVYCGSIGFLSPQRCGWWNVAIRTAQIDLSSGIGRFDAGGGIVADSRAASEWDEVLLKARFLRPPDDGFTLWETLASDACETTLDAHLSRLAGSAAAVGIAFDAGALRAALALHARAGSERRLLRVRLHADGGFTIRTDALERPAEVRVCLARTGVRSDDPYLRHKSSWRPAHDVAAADATARACFDAILRNERGELTEGARTNVFVRIDGRYHTPPLSCGLLPGILRSRIVSEGARERVLTPSDMERADALYVGNSARGLLRATLVDG